MQQLTNVYGLPQDVFDELIQALRCADADLQGIQERHDHGVFDSTDDREAARTTRKELTCIHRKLTSKSLLP